MSRGVVVIDDEVDLLLAVEVLLESAGYRVFGAQSGEEGLGLIEQKDPDVVILDVGLPGMGGVEVLKEIRARAFKAKVIMLSAHAGGQAPAAASRAGAVAYLVKPFSPDELMEALDGLFDDHPGANGDA